MEKLDTLFGKRATPVKLLRKTERGELFDTFLSYLNPPRARKNLPPISYGRLAYLLTGINTSDLYALLSKMRDGERRGVPAGAIFWSEIRPQQNV